MENQGTRARVIRATGETTRPWTRWWWMGSAMTAEEITRHLEAYAAAGIGGVEITPIYGVQGREEQYLPLLSPQWAAMLRHAIDEGQRLGVGVDMTLGSGWPYGGPQISPENAPRAAAFHQEQVAGGVRYSRTFANQRVEGACFLRTDGTVQRLPPIEGADTLTCVAPPEGATLFVLLSKPTGQHVKRAAPGGAGQVMCPYSLKAFDQFIAPYTAMLAASPHRPRCAFYDSFEVFGADFTPGLVEEFKRRKKYCLRKNLPALAGHGDAELISRVRYDYRDVLFALLLEHGITPWAQWAASFGIGSRYQAHGAPGNLIDLYAAADIPETEVFGTNRFPWIALESHPEVVPPEYVLVNKLASSAAHLTGKPLVSSETFTWLREHFCTALSDLKPEVDQLFLAGINHIFFHGSTYSPADAPYPGWLFYASTHFDPGDTLWQDLPEFNRYVRFCQEILQNGQVVNDLLVYFPFHDIISRPGNALFMQLSVHGVKQFIGEMDWGKLAMRLWDEGYAFDFVSDRLLETLTGSGQEIRSAGGQYRAIVIPPCRHMPLATMRKLLELAQQGTLILTAGALPGSEPGMAGLGSSGEFLQIRAALARHVLPLEQLTERGILPLLAGPAPGLRAIRIRRDGQVCVFLANLSAQTVDEYVPLPCQADAWQMVDPITGQAGRVAARPDPAGCEVYLQLQPGASVWLLPADPAQTRSWPRMRTAGNPFALGGTWTIQPVSGGPALPSAVQVTELDSWTTFADPAWRDFSGTVRYTLAFEHPDTPADAWVLRFPGVGNSVWVSLNGQPAGTLWAHPFELPVTLRPGRNTLICEVTNLSANRVAALDRQGIPWRNFHEINFVNIDYKPFDASTWPPRPSGLLQAPELCPMAMGH